MAIIGYLEKSCHIKLMECIWPLRIQATLLNPDMYNPDSRLNRTIGRSQFRPMHIIPLCMIRILPNPDRNLGSTSVRIKHNCL